MIALILKKNGVPKNDLKETTKVFNNYYINIVETTSGKPPSSPAGKYWSPGRPEDVPLQRPQDVP